MPPFPEFPEKRRFPVNVGDGECSPGVHRTCFAHTVKAALTKGRGPSARSQCQHQDHSVSAQGLTQVSEARAHQGGAVQTLCQNQIP